MSLSIIVPSIFFLYHSNLSFSNLISLLTFFTSFCLYSITSFARFHLLYCTLPPTTALLSSSPRHPFPTLFMFLITTIFCFCSFNLLVFRFILCLFTRLPPSLSFSSLLHLPVLRVSIHAPCREQATLREKGHLCPWRLESTHGSNEYVTPDDDVLSNTF